MPLPPTDVPDVAAVPRSSVPLCAAKQVGIGVGRGISSGEIVAVYVTALIYIVFDLFIFHWLSGWLTALIEVIELAPILIGVWFYWRSWTRRGGRRFGIQKVLFVPVLSTMIQLQILVFAGIYHHVGLS